MYLSRLAAQKEFAVMKVLYREGFVVPEPIAWSRHTVVMSFIDAFPLRMIESCADDKVGKLYAELMDMIVSLAQRGLIHGDFNEFNVLVKEEELGAGDVKLGPVLIDFPQAVSTNHVNAQMYFDRDVACVKRYFERRFKYVSDEAGPYFKDAVSNIDPARRIDVEVEASGFSKKMARDLESYVEASGGDQAGLEDYGTDGPEDDAESDTDDGIEPNTQSEESWAGSDQLAESIGTVSLEEVLAAKHTHIPDYGLAPLELHPGQDTIDEHVQVKKKAAGWSI